MSWRDRLRPASFRGVPFYVEQADTRRAKHSAEYSFPGRDRSADSVHVEDLGAGPNRYQLTGFVIGEDYDRAREALEAALLEPGPGRLVHPYRGERMVSVIGEILTTETHRRGGEAQIRFSVVETTEPTMQVEEIPDVEAPRAAAVAAAAATVDVDALDSAGAAVRSSTLATFDAALRQGRAAYTVLARELGVVGAVTSRADALTALADDFAVLPSAAIGDLSEAIGALFDAAVEPIVAPGRAAKGAMAALDVFLDGLDDDEASRPVRRADEERLRRQLADYARGAWLAYTAELAGRVDYESRTQALAIRLALLARLDGYLGSGTPSDATVAGADAARAFEDLRATLSRRLNEVASTLPEVRLYTPGASLPALVIAHLVHGDATRADEVLERNPQSYPDLIPAGSTLEVLDDGT